METSMAWTAPVAEELPCGMAINMYFPAEEDGERN
jgi:coenzyme PQQ precursor peptide PqqA